MFHESHVWTADEWSGVEHSVVNEGPPDEMIWLQMYSLWTSRPTRLDYVGKKTIHNHLNA